MTAFGKHSQEDSANETYSSHIMRMTNFEAGNKLVDPSRNSQSVNNQIAFRSTDDINKKKDDLSKHAVSNSIINDMHMTSQENPDSQVFKSIDKSAQDAIDVKRATAGDIVRNE